MLTEVRHLILKVTHDPCEKFIQYPSLLTDSQCIGNTSRDVRIFQPSGTETGKIQLTIEN